MKKIILLILAIIVIGCATDDEFANPLDPENPRTGGSPPGLMLKPGDAQVEVLWQRLDLEGVAKYRIYRRFSGDLNSQFSLVGEVDGSKNSFNDTKDILNDQVDPLTADLLFYEYRISYVDENGIEAPDPNNPPEFWLSAKTTPSDPPPTPDLKLGAEKNLTVTLIWANYAVPRDFDRFRLMAKWENRREFVEIAKIESDQRFYMDTAFTKDGVEKIYRLIAVDQFGVEAIAQLKAESPHLPPMPPQNVLSNYEWRGFLNNKYVVTLTWGAVLDKDLKGYQIYSTTQNSQPTDFEELAQLPIDQRQKKLREMLKDGRIAPRRQIDRNATMAVLDSEDWVLDEISGQLVLKRYFVAAYDDTPRSDGTQDESDLMPFPVPDTSQ